MRRKHNNAPGRHLLKLFNKYGTLGAQIFNDVAVMDDFVTHIDRCAVQFKRALNDIDCTINTCAKPTGLRQDNLGALNGKIF